MAKHNISWLDVSVNDVMLVELEDGFEDVGEKFFYIELGLVFEKVAKGLVHPLNHHL